MWEMAPDAHLIVHNTKIGFRMLEWTQAIFKQFKECYRQALLDGLTGGDTFMFDNKLFVVAYAKYLIEYIELNGQFDEYLH